MSKPNNPPTYSQFPAPEALAAEADHLEATTPASGASVPAGLGYATKSIMNDSVVVSRGRQVTRKKTLGEMDGDGDARREWVGDKSPVLTNGRDKKPTKHTEDLPIMSRRGWDR